MTKELAKINSSRPAIICDFGGTTSMSFLRIASSPGIKELATAGKVMFVITNLGFDLDKTLELKESNEEFSAEKIEFIKTNRHLVNYVNSDAAELRNVKIKNAFSGKTISLDKNIDLLHEDIALTHGLKSDVDIYLLGNILSNRGSLFMGSTQPHGKLSDSPEAKFNLSKTFELGFKNLSKTGVKEYISPRKIMYKIFTKPKAPDIDQIISGKNNFSSLPKIFAKFF